MAFKVVYKWYLMYRSWRLGKEFRLSTLKGRKNEISTSSYLANLQQEEMNKKTAERNNLLTEMTSQNRLKKLHPITVLNHCIFIRMLNDMDLHVMALKIHMNNSMILLGITPVMQRWTSHSMQPDCDLIYTNTPPLALEQRIVSALSSSPSPSCHT